MKDTQRERRGHDFLPTEAKEWAKLYSTEGTKVGDKLIVAHYFVANANWYVVEADVEQEIGFGYADLGNGTPEWGNMSFTEMEEVVILKYMVVERDLHWTPKIAREVLPPAAWAWNDGDKEASEKIY